MSITSRYQAYADAFEDSYEDDDWTRIEPYFTENAVYEGEPEASGNAAVLAKLKTAVDSFDRLMDSRTLGLEALAVEGDTVRVEWNVTYTKSDCPDLAISGRETAVFEGDRIARLRDDFDPAAATTMTGWMSAHSAKLQG